MTIVIDTELIKKENLTLIDSIILSFILAFKENGYFGKIEFIAENLNLGRATIFKSLSKLKKLNLIYKKQNIYYAKYDLIQKSKKQSTIETQQSTIETQQSTIETQQSTIETQQSTIETPYPYYNKKYNYIYNKEYNTLSSLSNESERIALIDLFEIFWKKYPKKIDKAKCVMFFKRRHELVLKNKNIILTALENHIKSDQWNRDNGRFIPYPYKWLNENQWELELKQAKANEYKQSWTAEYRKELENL